MGKIYTAIKGFVVMTTAASSVAIFIGVAGTSAIATYVLGGAVGLGALFLAFDTFGMAKALEKLNKENDRLHQSNTDYVRLNLQHESSIKNLRTENSQYADNNKTLANQIDLLKGQAARFQDSITGLVQNNQVLQKNLISLQDQAESYKKSNILFASNNQDLSNQLASMRQTSDVLAARVTELTSLEEQQKRQIDSLRLVQAQSKSLIQALMTAGDDFKQFQSTLTDSMDRIEHTSDAMTLLLDRLHANQFHAIDANQDGSITREELERWSAGKA